MDDDVVVCCQVGRAQTERQRDRETDNARQGPILGHLCRGRVRPRFPHMVSRSLVWYVACPKRVKYPTQDVALNAIDVGPTTANELSVGHGRGQPFPKLPRDTTMIEIVLNDRLGKKVRCVSIFTR